MKRIACLAIFSVALTTSCVTVNVNFPESAVQKATDNYVRDLYEKKEKKPEPAPSSAVRTMIDWSISSNARAFARWIEMRQYIWILPSALADETVTPQFKVDSPKAQEIKQQLKALVPDIVEQKRNGNLGETSTGMVAIKNKSLPPLLEKKLTQLVKDENAARRELYKEILRANGMSSGQISVVEKSFARSFQMHSPPGTWIEDPATGAWLQK